MQYFLNLKNMETRNDTTTPKSSLPWIDMEHTNTTPYLPYDEMESDEMESDPSKTLDVILLDSLNNLYKDIHHNFIIHLRPDGSLAVLGVEEDGPRRNLTCDEKTIAKSLGLEIIDNTIE